MTARLTAPFTVLLAALSLLAVVLCACTYQRGGGMRVATIQQKGPVPTGVPLVLGFVTQEDSPTGSFPETRRAAEAAVAYVNEDLGGVEGRPLRLRSCRTDGSPESSQACARQLLAARPLAVVGGVDFGAGAALPAYEKAKVPYVSGSPQLLAELIDPNSYALTGGTAAELLGTADYLINTLHVHKVNALYVDLPGLLASATASAKTIFDKKKIANRLVAEKADAADFTPALTSATAGKPDAVVIVFPAASCQRILQAAAGLGTTVPLVVPGSCAVPRVLASAGPTVPVLAASNYTLVPATGGTPEEQAYRQLVSQADQAPIAQAAFSTVLDVRRLLVILAVEGNEIVGSVIAGWDGWRCHLYRIAVRADRRRQGIAKDLIAAAEERFAAQGARRVDAMVLEDDTLGQAAWAALGYVPQHAWRRWVRRLDAR